MGRTLFWYDFETTGIDTRRDRPLQVAGVRTDEDFNEIGEPLNIDCRLAEDCLPAPGACLVTGIGPERVRAGLPEAEFIRRLHEQMAQPGTCSAGYNNLRFDDEMTRFTLYRNYFDPYAREWQSGNSRWDLLGALRTAQALRPEGIVWPQQDGLPSLRLELLTEANGIAHVGAHDALADVRATIAMARLLKQAQPRLYDYLYALRDKQRVLELINFRTPEPLVHVSGRIGRDRNGLTLVLPLGWHPQNRNALIVWDLAAEPQQLFELSPELLRERLYTRNEDLPDGVERPGLKLVQINRCPVLANRKVLREGDIDRLQLDMPLLQQRAVWLAERREQLGNRLAQIYQPQADRAHEEDAELRLYGGFLDNADRNLMADIRESEARRLLPTLWPLRDQRLVDMLPRYRARNYPESLDVQQRQDWLGWCARRLAGELPGAAITLQQFMQQVQQLLPECNPEQRQLLEDWRCYADQLRETLGLTG